MAGIYIHIPFCKQACYYCDFHFSTNQKSQPEMASALAAEIQLQKNYLGDDIVETIYFGGGTPSILLASEIKAIIDSINHHFNVNASEVTLEANPDDLNPEKLKALKGAGVNRLSIGIQSFDEGILKMLNRVHNAAMAIQCVEDAYAVGFDNVSIDLIYAIPGQDEDLWKQNVTDALQFRPQHISAYALTIEEKTVFGRRAATGNFKGVEDDLAATQLQMLVEILGQSGYEHYEVSNFSLPGYQSKHNSNYWKDEKYLGIGPSAHSYNGVSRQYNVSNNRQYLDSMARHTIPATIEVLSHEDLVNEYLLTNLRTSWGIDVKKLLDLYGYDLLGEHRDYIRVLQQNALAIVNGHQLVLTEKGRLLADQIASDLFVLAPGR